VKAPASVMHVEVLAARRRDSQSNNKNEGLLFPN
jgi:hypothetical protein